MHESVLDRGRGERLSKYREWAQYLTVAALVVSVLYGATLRWGAGAGKAWIAAFAVCLAAAAPFALGVFVGFLFGMPKTRPATPKDGEGNGILSNTNLEQVSDWLTKILIGVGLTQLTQLPAEIQGVAEYLAHAVGSDQAGTSAVFAAILVYFGITGFLWGYLVTKLILEPELGRRPDPAAVIRLANAKPPDLEHDAVDEHDAAEVLRFPPAKLKTSEELIAWGRAKLRFDRNSTAALDALGTAAEQAPTDRRAVENLALAALYAPPPEGFRRTIEIVRTFLAQPRRKLDPRDAHLHAYLACAYGQQYEWAAGERATPEQLAEIRGHAVAAVRQAIELEPRWRSKLRMLAAAEPGSEEDDLVALKDDAELKELLGL